MGSWYLSVVRKLLCLSIFSFLLFACGSEDEEYPFDQSPYIEFEEILYLSRDEIAEIGVASGSGALELSFLIYDLEGDIGSSIEEGDHFINLIVDDNGLPVTLNGDHPEPYCYLPIDHTSYQEVRAEYQSSECETDRIINSRPPFSCSDYLIKEDTFYIENIESFYNLQFDFFNAESRRIDISEFLLSNECSLQRFYGRMPVLKDYDGSVGAFLGGVFDISKRDKFSWNLKYYIFHDDFGSIFKEKKWRLDFWIFDRALNKSNIASSGLVTLEEITAQ